MSSTTGASAATLIADCARRLDAAGVHFGHGTDNAEDEAAFLVLHALGLPFDVPRADYQRARSPAEVARVEALVEARIARRVPAAYLTRRMWFCGHEFAVDERVLVPRSPLAELIERGFTPWLAARAPRRILDIGTGSGCIAIAVALAFPDAHIDATDASADALAVAAANCARHGVAGRVALYEADLFPPAPGRYDLIVSNPPYVPAARHAELPAEYQYEPRLALVADDDGCALVERILARAPALLSAHGLLVVEVGEMWPTLAARHPRLPFTWVEFERGGEGVFVLSRDELAAAQS